MQMHLKQYFATAFLKGSQQGLSVGSEVEHLYTETILGPLRPFTIEWYGLCIVRSGTCYQVKGKDVCNDPAIHTSLLVTQL